jgi:anti-sigma regulatory factor (Ser/Thr protein kinase)
MVRQQELRVKANIANLGSISEFVRDVGRYLGLPEDTLFDIDLAVEEAASNIIRHAYPPGLSGDMLLRIETTDDVVRVVLTDWGQPFDADTVRPFDLDASAETRAKGGTGLHLIRSLMDDVVRETSPSVGGPNVLILSKRMEH